MRRRGGGGRRREAQRKKRGERKEAIHESWPSMAISWPNLAEIGNMLAKLGSHWRRHGPFRPALAGFGLKLGSRTRDGGSPGEADDAREQKGTLNLQNNRRFWRAPKLSNNCPTTARLLSNIDKEFLWEPRLPQISPESLARVWPMLANVWPVSAKAGQHLFMMADCLPICAKFGPHLVQFDQRWARLARCLPGLVKFGIKLADIDRSIWPMLATCGQPWPTSANHWTTS